MKEKNRILIMILTSLNAALYTVIGYLTYSAIVIMGVRFWPAVARAQSFRRIIIWKSTEMV